MLRKAGGQYEKKIITGITTILVSTGLMAACANTQNADSDPALLYGNTLHDSLAVPRIPVYIYGYLMLHISKKRGSLLTAERWMVK